MFDMSVFENPQVSKILDSAVSKAQSDEFIGQLLLFKAGLGQDGWVTGREAKTVTGSEVLLLATSFTKGYVAFEQDTNKFLGEEPGEPVFSTRAADASDLQSIPNAVVSPQTCVKVLLLESETQATLKGGTTGMENALNPLILNIADRARRGEKKYLNPRVVLKTSSYKHKLRNNIIWVPVLELVAWCDAENNEKPQQERIAEVI